MYRSMTPMPWLPACGVDGHGNIMILGSPDTGGTLAAADYVTSPGYAAQLRRLLERGRNDLPEAFQVVVKATIRADGPSTIKPVAQRVLRPVPPVPLVANP
jgi:hypothetical protein